MNLRLPFLPVHIGATILAVAAAWGLLEWVTWVGGDGMAWAFFFPGFLILFLTVCLVAAIMLYGGVFWLVSRVPRNLPWPGIVMSFISFGVTLWLGSLAMFWFGSKTVWTVFGPALSAATWVSGLVVYRFGSRL